MMMKFFTVLIFSLLTISFNTNAQETTLGNYTCTFGVAKRGGDIYFIPESKEIKIPLNKEELKGLKEERKFQSEDFEGFEFEGEIHAGLYFDASVEIPILVAQGPELVHAQLEYSPDGNNWSTFAASSIYGLSALVLDTNGHPEIEMVVLSCGLYKLETDNLQTK